MQQQLWDGLGWCDPEVALRLFFFLILFSCWNFNPADYNAISLTTLILELTIYREILTTEIVQSWHTGIEHLLNSLAIYDSQLTLAIAFYYFLCSILKRITILYHLFSIIYLLFSIYYFLVMAFYSPTIDISIGVLILLLSLLTLALNAVVIVYNMRQKRTLSTLLFFSIAGKCLWMPLFYCSVLRCIPAQPFNKEKRFITSFFYKLGSSMNTSIKAPTAFYPFPLLGLC